MIHGWGYSVPSRTGGSLTRVVQAVGDAAHGSNAQKVPREAQGFAWGTVAVVAAVKRVAPRVQQVVGAFGIEWNESAIEWNLSLFMTAFPVYYRPVE